MFSRICSKPARAMQQFPGVLENWRRAFYSNNCNCGRRCSYLHNAVGFLHHVTLPEFSRNNKIPPIVFTKGRRFSHWTRGMLYHWNTSSGSFLFSLSECCFVARHWCQALITSVFAALWVYTCLSTCDILEAKGRHESALWHWGQTDNDKLCWRAQLELPFRWISTLYGLKCQLHSQPANHLKYELARSRWVTGNN